MKHSNPTTDSADTPPSRKVALVDVADLDELRDELRAMRDELRAMRDAGPALVGGIVDGRAFDRALGISAATRGRLVTEGMPHETVGTRRRYDLAACRAWLAARGSKPTKVMQAPPKAADEDPIDVSRVLGKAGLRRVGGR